MRITVLLSLRVRQAISTGKIKVKEIKVNYEVMMIVKKKMKEKKNRKMILI